MSGRDRCDEIIRLIDKTLREIAPFGTKVPTIHHGPQDYPVVGLAQKS